MKGRPVRLDELAGRVARDLGIEQRVVAQDDDTVLRDRAVEFKRGHAKSQGSGESLECVLGPEPATPAVALQVEGPRGHPVRLDGGGGPRSYRERQREKESDGGEKHALELIPITARVHVHLADAPDVQSSPKV